MKPIDRSEAVNLARNFLGDQPLNLTPKGIRTLCHAVLAMDAELSRLYVQDKSVKEARQQLQWIAMQEDKAKEFEARGEERIPCFLGIEYVKKCAQVYRELSSCERDQS